jgi:integrase
MNFNHQTEAIMAWWGNPPELAIKTPVQDVYVFLTGLVARFIADSAVRIRKEERGTTLGMSLLMVLLGDARAKLKALNNVPSEQQKWLVQQLQKKICAQTYWLTDEHNPESLSHMTLEKLSDIFTVLNHLIDYGNFENLWSVCLFNHVARVNRAVNPLSKTGAWQKHIAIEKLYLAIQQSIKPREVCLDAQHWHGVLLFSLMVDSLILTEKKLHFVYFTLWDSTRWQFHADRLFVTIPSKSSNPDERVYLSRLSELLLYRIMYLKIAPPAKAQLNLILHQLVRHVGLQVSHYPRWLSGWLKDISHYLTKFQPSFVIAYAQGEMDACSLNAQSGVRVFNLQAQALTDLDGVEIAGDVTHVENETPPAYVSAHGLVWTQLRKLFEHKRVDRDREQVVSGIIAAIDTFLIDHQASLHANHLLMLDYARMDLLPKSRVQTGSSPSVIMKRLDSIGNKLVIFAASDAINTMSATARINLYSAVIETAMSQRHKQTLQYDLQRFDRWLSTHQHAELIDDVEAEELFGDAISTRNTVNANLITFDEYLAVLDFYREYCSIYPQDSIAFITMSVLILGFRCGLRRTEAMELKFADYIYCDISPRILIRESSATNAGQAKRELKTANAKRNLSLAALMPEHEWKILNSWFLQRQSVLSQTEDDTDTPSSQYLFALPNHAHPVSNQLVIKPLMEVVRQITSDSTLKFHQLRHSLASWQMLAAFIAEFNLDVSSFFAAHPQTQDWLTQALVRKAHHLPSNPADNSRKYAYWLRQLMGHGNIEMTLSNYIHFMDVIMLGMVDRQMNQQLTQQRVATVSGIAISTIKKTGGDPLQTALNKSRNKLQDKQISKRAASPQKIWQPAVTAKAILLSAYAHTKRWMMPDLVLQKCLQGMQIDEIAQDTGLDVASINKILTTYRDNPIFRLSPLTKTELAQLQLLIIQLDKRYPNWCIEPASVTVNPELYGLIMAFVKALKSMGSQAGNDNGAESCSAQSALSSVTDVRLVVKDPVHLEQLLTLGDVLNIPVTCLHIQGGGVSDEKRQAQIAYWRACLPATVDIQTKNAGTASLGANGHVEVRFLNNPVVGKARHYKNKAAYWLVVQMAVWGIGKEGVEIMPVATP